MTMQAIPPRWVPSPPPFFNNVVTRVAFTFDAGTDKLALVFQAPKAGDLDRVELLFGTITTWPASGVKVGWQNLTETAVPSVPDGTYTHSYTITSAPTADTWYVPSTFVDGGAARRTVTKGEALSFVIELANTGETPNFTVPCLDGLTTSNQEIIMPYFVGRTAAAYAQFFDKPCLALFYNGDTHPVFLSSAVVPVNGTDSTSVTSISSANPKYAGLLFQVPYKVTIDGMWAWIDCDEIESVLLCTTNAGSPLVSVTWDKDRRQDNQSSPMYFQFTASQTLSVNTDYRLIIKNSASATVCGLRQYDIPTGTPAYAAATEWGSTAQLTTSSDGTSWSNSDAAIPLIGWREIELDDGAGGSGGGIRMAGHGGLAA